MYPLLAQGKEAALEIEMQRGDGSLFWCRLEANALDASKPQDGSIWIVEDITQRKQGEEQIRRLKNYLANIIDSMPSVLVGMDRNEIVTQWNRQAEEMTGISAKEAVGRSITHLLPDFSPWIEVIRSEIEQQRPASMEKLLIEKEGERHFFDLMFYPLRTNGVEGAVVRIEDVTERTRIQELMIQTEKMLSVGGLAAGMAHEINNPLGIITQAIQNIERRVSPGLSGNLEAAEELGVSMEGVEAYLEQRRIPEFISSIRTASSRAAKIVANMLQFSRRAEAIMQHASLAGIMDQALELAASDYDLKKKFDFRSIEIIRDYAPDMPEVPMVAVEIEQVMLNLLSNAAQAMYLNPPDLKPRITLRLRRKGGYALFEVEDNGPGMEDKVRRRVFEPFFTTKEPGIGTGLGLSVSYMIVTKNHKGLMEVESLPGKGACFRVRLPLSKENNQEKT
jgi:PAS domain S-box-containing protein